MSPAKKRRAASELHEDLQMSERRICRALGQPRSTQRHRPTVTIRETTVRAEILRLACQYGRYGYRRIARMLQDDGWKVNHKCVERIWRQEGLKVPRKQPKRRRLWFNDGSCVRLRPEHKNHVWSYDFVTDWTSNGRAIRLLTILDEHSRECLAIKVGRKLTSYDVIEQLADLMVERGTPDHLRSDNGREFTAEVIRGWLGRLGVRTLFIEPGSPWENGSIESFNGRLRDELLNGEIFDTMLEAQVVIEGWRREYNPRRPHSSLGYRPPAPAAILTTRAHQLDPSEGNHEIQVGTP